MEEILKNQKNIGMISPQRKEKPTDSKIAINKYRLKFLSRVQDSTYLVFQVLPVSLLQILNTLRPFCLSSRDTNSLPDDIPGKLKETS